MASIINNDASSIVYRPVEKHEYQQALDLWYSTFGYLDRVTTGYYERSFSSEASPQYQTDDTLGAFHDGKLVSTVHIRRFTFRLRNDNQEHLCAFISNVATMEEYRKRGYSRHLLRMALDKMEKGGEFDMTLLEALVPTHYSVLGWEQVPNPALVSVEWKDLKPASDNVEWRTAADVLWSDGQLLLEIYSNKPRAYQFDCSPFTMFQHWAGYYWQRDEAIICVLGGKEQGYVVIKKPNHPNDVSVTEWRAPNIDVEKKLFQLAADEIRRRHPETKLVRFHGVPQHLTLDELQNWAGVVNVEKNDCIMLCNIRLPKETFEDMKIAFHTGETIWWQCDYF